MWRVAPSCLFWTFWKERNKRTFGNTEKVDQAIKQSFIHVFLEWVRVHIGDSYLLLFDFIIRLSCKKGERVLFCVSFCFFCLWHIIYIKFTFMGPSGRCF